MQNSQLQKAINLAKKTGDRLIVLDPAKEDSAFVVMSIEQYEDLTLGRGSVRDLTEDQLLDKINRDIAVWKSENDFSAFERKNSRKTSEEINEYENYDNTEEDECECGLGYCENKKEDEEDEEYEIENLYKDDFSSPGLRNMKNNFGSQKPKKKWNIPSYRKSAAEEVIEEDRQYLEDIPF